MTETRIDQLTGLRVLLDEAEPAAASDADGPAPEAAGCPLCMPGSAGLAEVWSAGDVRVFASEPGDSAPGPESAVDSGLSSAADPLRASTRGSEQSLFGSQPALGATELIASSSEHVGSLADLGDEAIVAAVAAWKARMAVHAPASSYVSLSLDEALDAPVHSHAVLRALDFVPAEVARERERSAAYHERTMGGHLLGDVATEEIRRRERFVAVDDEAILVCPWASRSPFELRIIPRTVAPSFESDPGGGAMLATAVRLLGDALGPDRGLAISVRTAPRGTDEFCWHVDLIPRPGRRDGFGLGTGVELNRLAPEDAARRLREAHAARRRSAQSAG